LASRVQKHHDLCSVKINFDSDKIVKDDVIGYEGAMAEKSGYHHGALRQALLEGALAILEEEGQEALTLRRLAARIGVSHAAPAHHFPSATALRTALAVIGFERFSAAMAEQRANAEAGPASQLRAAEAGYLRYASENPALFRLMFDKSRVDYADPALGSAASAAYGHLAEVSAPAAIRLGMDSASGRGLVEGLVWSQVHGRACLSIDNRMLDPSDCDDAAAPGTLDLAMLFFGEAAS
jgi:AcrR family transcriptional regulator